MELAIPSRFWLFLFVFFIVSTSLSKEPKHTSLSHTQKPQCCCVFLAYLMFLNRIHHSNKIFCSKLKNPKIRSLSLAETISSNLTRPWLFFFFLIKLNPYTTSTHSYIDFNRFTSTKFDQNFENLKLGICGCVGNTMISGEHSRGGEKRKHVVSR